MAGAVAKILVVEDDADQREVYSKLLYYNGFDVVSAEDGQAGVAEAIAEHPDAILMDVMLPGLNGLLATQRITSNPATADIPIICMSAYEVNQNQVRHSGAREFLHKPVSGDTLVRAIRKYIGWNDGGSVPSD